MRIISGKNRGRKIIAPASLPVRPTTDLAKESLFNILSNRLRLDNLTILDLFAGTGNISYEFASRGCKSITSVDKDAKCINFIEQTASNLDFQNLTAIRSDYLQFINTTIGKWDVIFADPPYQMENILDIPLLIFEHKLLNDEGLFIIEHDKHIDFSGLKTFDQRRKYGKVNFSFFANATS
ncbi:MAG: 16S rRNA (guanine(966)-N(2))-methyltransferase RsmD [Bacteroidales bacterium]|nr:16S rRNA (guanine(966)-N(2))-methyltransferase RsmD [Bacteroidales bacterium]